MNTSSSLYFTASGPANAPTIVFLHGGGAASWMWESVIRQLSDYHCLAPDLPEQGESRAIAPFSVELAAAKITDLILEQAHGGKAVVVGLSEGAQVAVQLLATQPDLVEKAIISSALLRAIPGMGWASSPAILKWTYRMSIPPFIHNDRWIRINMKYSAGIPDEYFALFKKGFQETSESQFVNMMIANQQFRMPKGLEKAGAPTLVLAGKHEYSGMKQSVKELVSALPNVRGGLIHLGKSTSMAGEHNWALTAPETFAQTIRAWIEGKTLPKEILEM